MSTAAHTYAMLENETLWQAAQSVHSILAKAGLPHGVLGGVAVCLHGYRRNTVDIDLLIRPVDGQEVRDALEAAGWTWSDAEKELLSPQGVALHFLLAGSRAGRDTQVNFPDPSDPETLTEIENLPVLTLARLIETKLASGQGNLRRTHRDFADVVELIAVRNLNSSFARHLHKSLRETYRELVRHARDETP